MATNHLKGSVSWAWAPVGKQVGCRVKAQSRRDPKPALIALRFHRRSSTSVSDPSGPADRYRNPRAVVTCSIVVQDRAVTAALREQPIAAQPEQVEIERLAGLLLVVRIDFDGDGLRRFAGSEDQGAGIGGVIIVAGRGGAVDGLERTG